MLMSVLDKPLSRLADERQTADTNAEKLPKDSLDRWRRCQSSHRFLSFLGKQLVAYRLFMDSPEVIDTFTCEGFDAGLQQGVSSLWRSSNAKEGGSFWVSATPKEVAPGCFLYMLKYTSLEWVPYKDSESLRFSMAYRTTLNPGKREEGVPYLLERSVFHTVFD